MPLYNILTRINLDVSVGIDIPAEITKRGEKAIREYAENNIAELINDVGIAKLDKMVYNYCENKINVNAEDATRIKCSDDDLENDLMEFDIFD